MYRAYVVSWPSINNLGSSFSFSISSLCYDMTTRWVRGQCFYLHRSMAFLHSNLVAVLWYWYLMVISNSEANQFDVLAVLNWEKSFCWLKVSGSFFCYETWGPNIAVNHVCPCAARNNENILFNMKICNYIYFIFRIIYKL